MVGAYPKGQHFDMRYGDPAEYEKVVDKVQSVPLPSTDPVSGESGPLMELWSQTKIPG